METQLSFDIHVHGIGLSRIIRLARARIKYRLLIRLSDTHKINNASLFVSTTWGYTTIFITYTYGGHCETKAAFVYFEKMEINDMRKAIW